MRLRSGPDCVPARAGHAAHPCPAGAEGGPDEVIARELPAEYVPAAIRSYRVVLDWTRGPAEFARLHPAVALRAWEQTVLDLPSDDDLLWASLAVIANGVRDRGQEAAERIVRGCTAMVERNLESGARGTAVLFAEAAALACPGNARLSFMAGRLFRRHGSVAAAELWLRRGCAAAGAGKDSEAAVLCLHELGDLLMGAGRDEEGRERLRDGVRVARRAGLREREGALLHDLLVLSRPVDLAEAEGYARAACAAYPAGHPHRVHLAVDVAMTWLWHGRLTHAFQLLTKLCPVAADSPTRLHVNALLAHAAGVIGETDTFRQAWQEVRKEMSSSGADARLRAFVCLELGLGALGQGLWKEAEGVLQMARDAIEEARAYDLLAPVQGALERAWREELVVTPAPSLDGGPSDRLARALVAAMPAAIALRPNALEPVDAEAVGA